MLVEKGEEKYLPIKIATIRVWFPEDCQWVRRRFPVEVDVLHRREFVTSSWEPIEEITKEQIEDALKEKIDSISSLGEIEKIDFF